jgi:hypothetical protein
MVQAVTRSLRPDCLKEKRAGSTDGITITRDRQHLTCAAIQLDLDDHPVAKVVEGADEVEGVSGHGKVALSSEVDPGRVGRFLNPGRHRDGKGIPATRSRRDSSPGEAGRPVVPEA